MLKKRAKNVVLLSILETLAVCRACLLQARQTASGLHDLLKGVTGRLLIMKVPLKIMA